jgi:hypothetical protein
MTSKRGPVPPKLRCAIIALREVAGMSYDDICTATKVHPETARKIVKRTIARARAQCGLAPQLPPPLSSSIQDNTTNPEKINLLLLLENCEDPISNRRGRPLKIKKSPLAVEPDQSAFALEKEDEEEHAVEVEARLLSLQSHAVAENWDMWSPEDAGLGTGLGIGPGTGIGTKNTTGNETDPSITPGPEPMPPVINKTITAYQSSVDQTCGSNTLIHSPINPYKYLPWYKFA